MKSNTDFNIVRLIEELDSAVAREDVQKADEIADMLFRLQGGDESEARMPGQFPLAIENYYRNGGHHVKKKSFKKLIGIAAAAVLVMALGITALATDLFGIRELVIRSGEKPSESPEISPSDIGAEQSPAISASGSETDLIVLQGYPDSNEYKASEEWVIFCRSYDPDGSIALGIGNAPNEYTEAYPMYLVYTQEMANKLEEIIAKYGLKLHSTIVTASGTAEFIYAAGTGNFLGHSESYNAVLGGYAYDDGSFHYDGEAFISGSKISYQLGNYVKGTFSDTYLNIGDADSYEEWSYKTSSGVPVYLALSESKALVIADLKHSFVTINVLSGTADGETKITKDVLQQFADSFDFTQFNQTSSK
jgi:hypothetical protein